MAKKAVVAQKSTEIFNYLYMATWAILPLVYLFYKDNVQDPGLYPRFVLIAISTLVGAALLFTKKVKALPFRLTLAAISFFVIWHFAGYSNALAKTEFWATFARNGLMLAYLLLTFQLLRNQLLSFKSIIKSATIFAGISALSLLPDILEVMKGSNFIKDIYTVHGLFSHKNFAASALLLAVPFLYLGTRDKDKTWRIIATSTLVLAIVEILILRTRGVWIGFLGGVGATVVLQLLSKQKANGQLKWVGIGTGVFAVLLSGIFLFGKNAESILNRDNIDVRMFYWESCVKMAQENPITGVGAGNWKINFPKYGLAGTNQSVMEGETQISRPHNDMLWVLSEMGIPAWVALAVFQLFLLFIGVKLLNHTDGEKRDYAMASIFALVAFAGYGLGEFPLERPVAVGLLVLMAAEALRLAEEEGILKKPLFIIQPNVLNGIIIFLGLIGIWIGNARVQGEKKANLAVQAYLKQDPGGMLKNGELAKNRFFSVDMYNSPMQYFTGLGYSAGQQFKKAEAEFIEGLSFNPYHINSMVQLGDVYKYQKQFDKALVEYDRALAISPQLYRANLDKCEVYLYTNNTIEALRCLNRVSHKTEYPKFGQVGVEILKRFAKMPDQTLHPDLQEIARNNEENPAELWNNYLAWKKNLMTDQ